MTGSFDGTLLLVGAGKMGMALVEGFVRDGVPPAQILAQDPAPDAAIEQRLMQLGISCVPQADTHLPTPPAVLLLAVKPQVLDDVGPGLKESVGAETLVLSVLAGKPLSVLQSTLGADRAIVRAMPNTPAAIGRGMTACVANAHVTKTQRAQADRLFASAGEVAWIEDESLMDAVTAVSGSGPAYVFLLAEAMADAGVAAGLEPKLAGRLARATISGAGQLLAQSDETAETLRKAVTSPGGTTAAALQVLMEKRALKGLLEDAVKAAKKRSEDLAG